MRKELKSFSVAVTIACLTKMYTATLLLRMRSGMCINVVIYYLFMVERGRSSTGRA